MDKLVFDYDFRKGQPCAMYARTTAGNHIGEKAYWNDADAEQDTKVAQLAYEQAVAWAELQRTQGKRAPAAEEQYKEAVSVAEGQRATRLERIEERRNRFLEAVICGR